MVSLDLIRGPTRLDHDDEKTFAKHLIFSMVFVVDLRQCHCQLQYITMKIIAQTKEAREDTSRIIGSMRIPKDVFEPGGLYKLQGRPVPDGPCYS